MALSSFDDSSQKECDCSRSSFRTFTSVSCKTYIPVAIQNFTWTISNFSCCILGNGEKIDSSTFYTDFPRKGRKAKWHLEIYPNGVNRNYNGSLSVFIVSHNDFPISVKYDISILNEQKEKPFFFSGQHLFTGSGVKVGSHRLLKREDLFKETLALLPADCLTLSCDLHIAGQYVNKKSKYFYSSIKNNLSEDLMKLFYTSEMSDITISVGTRDFRAHKAILVARSSVFSAMFKHEMKEKSSNTIYIDDADPKVMEQVLFYLYCGKCPLLIQMAADIIQVADKYDLGDLKDECEGALCKLLTIENALSYFIIAEKHNLQMLHSEAYNLLQPFHSYIKPDLIKFLTADQNYGMDYKSLVKLFLIQKLLLEVKDHAKDFRNNPKCLPSPVFPNSVQPAVLL